MFKKKLTDNEIIDSIKKGKADSVLPFLYKNVQPKINRWIVKNNGNIDEAHDIFQDAIVRLYSKIIDSKFKTDTNINIAGYIFQSCKNMWINRVKNLNKTSNELPIHLKNEEYHNNNDNNDEKQQRIIELFDHLGERCKELLTYSVFYKMTMEDISVRMGLNNANTAKTKNYKCKQRLIKLLKDNPELQKIF